MTQHLWESPFLDLDSLCGAHSSFHLALAVVAESNGHFIWNIHGDLGSVIVLIIFTSAMLSSCSFLRCALLSRGSTVVKYGGQLTLSTAMYRIRCYLRCGLCIRRSLANVAIFNIIPYV